MEPKVSIVIPFYNCAYIDQAIYSAVHQTYPHIEVIVVDDGSTQYVERVQPFMDRITYIRKENGGTATALNEGIKRATGDYFVWLSSDDVMLLDRVEKQLGFMLKVKALFCHGAYHYVNADNEWMDTIRPEVGSRLEVLQVLLEGCPINGCTVMVEMDAFRKFGMFDTDFRYTHDYEMWLRLFPVYELFYFNDPLVSYRVHEKMGTKRHFDELKAEMERVQAKHRPTLLNLLHVGGYWQ
ncbi:glycosyltransferase [Paenibacillus tundrae]|uniref:Glycosyltransferase involved in cell wall biosynthesis n=1 Tax=Paenibacillus tundrae TaxID=528187 RepID=A0ABT9WFR3_9BACL|nr:glycosyltransferase [Paenibacillus tundrae]MDQ0172108.1 glycosyltransferase involved in cell wall biosynthesis [Paenibacillus tundrae]